MTSVDVLKPARTFPVIETFGPTIQGEGPLAGLTSWFVRFGGCDYDCSWCDSPHAVKPHLIKEASELLTAQNILSRLQGLSIMGTFRRTYAHAGQRWVTLSGGNPALLNLDDLINELHRCRWLVSVETQGSKWKPWLADVDGLTVSPKGPSSGMAEKTARDLPVFMRQARQARSRKDQVNAIGPLDAIKVVVFNDADFEFALETITTYQDWPSYVSVGTDQEPPATLDLVAARYEWLCDKVKETPELNATRVLPQLHFIAWGHRRGV